MMSIKNILLLFVLMTSLSAHAADKPATKAQVKKAALSLIKRTLPAGLHKKFEVKIIDAANGADVFELYSKGNKIVLAGSNGIAVASALNYYLKHYAHCDMSWNGSNLAIPNP